MEFFTISFWWNVPCEALRTNTLVGTPEYFAPEVQSSLSFMSSSTANACGGSEVNPWLGVRAWQHAEQEVTVWFGGSFTSFVSAQVGAGHHWQGLHMLNRLVGSWRDDARVHSWTSTLWAGREVIELYAECLAPLTLLSQPCTRPLARDIEV
eukprot:5287463-Amphidinium_carterae.2